MGDRLARPSRPLEVLTVGRSSSESPRDYERHGWDRHSNPVRIMSGMGGIGTQRYPRGL